MKHSTLGVLAAALILATTSACGDAGDDTQNDGSNGDTEASTVNPVDVLRSVPGCEPEPGVEVGEQDMNGNFYATCDLPEVTTGGYVYQPQLLVRSVDLENVDDENTDAVPDDSHRVIDGDGFYVVVTADPAIFRPGMVDLDSIAEAVDGSVVPLS